MPAHPRVNLKPITVAQYNECWREGIDQTTALLSEKVADREAHKAAAATAAAAAAAAEAAASPAAAAPAPSDAGSQLSGSQLSGSQLSNASQLSVGAHKVQFLERQLKAERRKREELEDLLARVQNPTL